MTPIQIGEYVLLKSHIPYPRLMWRSVNRVVGVREKHGIELRVERRVRHRLRACWISIEHVERVVPESEAVPEDSCTLYGPRTRGSAREAQNRSWCLICSEKGNCPAYQQRMRMAG